MLLVGRKKSRLLPKGKQIHVTACLRFYHMHLRKVPNVTSAMGWNKVRAFLPILTKPSGYSFHYQWHVKPLLRSGSAVGHKVCRHHECSNLREFSLEADRSKCEHLQQELLQPVKEGFLGAACHSFLKLTPEMSREGHRVKSCMHCKLLVPLPCDLRTV